jgi:UDP-3-O-[3-hydroxymyristoyl] N-acetylglucosamine deacetylase
MTTINNPFVMEGVGLHSGEKVKLFFRPAPPDSGVCFLRAGKKIAALAHNVIDTRRGTSLDGVATVEHLLSAAYGIGLTDLEVEVEGHELPALDGSSLPYVEAFENAGINRSGAPGNILSLPSSIKIIEGDALLEAVPCRGFRIHFMVDFEGIGEQKFSFEPGKQSYKAEIAPARTFGYFEEYQNLKSRGLAQGASLENALVIGKEGYLNAPRFPDELVRHKILDLIGDLSLLGRPLQAEINAVKSGHKLNIELVRRVVRHG